MRSRTGSRQPATRISKKASLKHKEQLDGLAESHRLRKFALVISTLKLTIGSFRLPKSHELPCIEQALHAPIRGTLEIVFVFQNPVMVLVKECPHYI